MNFGPYGSIEVTSDSFWTCSFQIVVANFLIACTCLKDHLWALHQWALLNWVKISALSVFVGLFAGHKKSYNFGSKYPNTVSLWGLGNSS